MDPDAHAQAQHPPAPTTTSTTSTTTTSTSTTSTSTAYAPQSPILDPQSYAPESPKLDLCPSTPVHDDYLPVQRRQRYRGSISHPIPSTSPFGNSAAADTASAPRIITPTYSSPYASTASAPRIVSPTYSSPYASTASAPHVVSPTYSSPYANTAGALSSFANKSRRNDSASSAPDHIPAYTMPTRSARMKREPDDDDEWTPQGAAAPSVERMKEEPEHHPAHDDAMDTSDGGVKLESGQLAPGVAEGIEVKTKFPAARIKRIMQADEDVGKVAQVTPHVVAKALELFMISLVTKAAGEAKNRSSKRVSAAHLKQAVLSDSHFDFLTEIVSKVSDAPAPAPADRGGSPEEAGAEGKKRKVSRRKRKDSEEVNKRQRQEEQQEEEQQEKEQEQEWEQEQEQGQEQEPEAESEPEPDLIDTAMPPLALRPRISWRFINTFENDEG